MEGARRVRGVRKELEECQRENGGADGTEVAGRDRMEPKRAGEGSECR